MGHPNPKQPPKPAARPQKSAASPRPPGARPPVAAGRAVPGRVAPSAMQSGALLAAARSRPGRAAQENYARNQTIKLGILFVVGLAVVLGVVFGVKTMRGPAAPVLGHDAQAEKIMWASNYEEINSWLSQGIERSLVGHNLEQSKALADQIYALGPKRVLAGGGRASMHVIVELPADSEARVRLFEWQNKWAEKYGSEAGRQKDVGQKYLIATMPLNR